MRVLEGYESAAGRRLFFLTVNRAGLIIMSRGSKQIGSVRGRESDI